MVLFNNIVRLVRGRLANKTVGQMMGTIWHLAMIREKFFILKNIGIIIMV